MKKTFSLLTFLVLCICSVFFSACEPVKNKDVNGISLNYSSYSLVAGDDIDIIATITPNDAENKNVKFFVSDRYPFESEDDLTPITNENANVEFKVHERYSNIVNIKVKSTCTIAGSFYLNAISEDGLFEAHCLFNFYPPMKNLIVPQNVKYNKETKQVEWDAVENAKYYVININGTDYSTTFNYYSTFDENIMNNVKVKAIGEEYKFKDSEDSAQISFCILGSVKNLAHLGNRITWDAKDLQYVKGYIVSVDGVLHTIGKVDYYNLTTLTLPEGVHTIKVVAVGDETKNVFSKGAYSQIEIRRLSVPQNFTYSNGKLTWETLASERNSNFVLTFFASDGESLVLSETVSGLEYNFNNNLPEGTYDIILCAEGDNISTLSSSNATINSLRRLESPENLRIENGKLAWDDNEFATGYSININGNILEYDRPNDQAFETTYTLGSGYLPTQYNISICSKGNGTTTISSVYTKEIVSTKLNKPTNLQINNGVLIWDEVMANATTQATEYVIVFEGGLSNVSVNTNTYTFGNQTPPGDYSFKIMARAEGYFSSEFSLNKQVSKLDQISNLRVENGAIYYNSVAGAKEYKIKIGENEYISNGFNLLFKLEGAKYPAGTYNINVIACGNANNQINSNPLATTLEVVKLQMPSGFGVIDGELSFNAQNNVPNASGYIINFGGAEITDIEDLDITGTVILKIKAKGDAGGEGAKYIDSDYTPAFYASKLSPVSNLKIENGIFSFSPITGATNYDIIITNLNDDADVETINTVSDFTHSVYNKNAGVYSITVIPYGTTGNSGQQYVNNPSATNSITFTKLAQVENFKVAFPSSITEMSIYVPGSLIWDKVNSAVGYQLIVDGQEINFQTNEMIDMDQGNFMMYLGDTTIPAGEHVYQIYAKGNGTTIIEGAKSPKLTATKIESATNLRLENKSIVWDRPANCTYTAIYVDKQFINFYLEDSYEVPEKLGSGEYSVSILCVPNAQNYTVGNFSQPFTFKKLNAPSNIKIENGVLTWMTNLLGGGYKIKINNGIEDEIIDVLNDQGNFDNSINTYNFAENYRNKPGTYTISMLTLGNGTITSNYSTSIMTTVLNYPQNLKTENGKLVFNVVPNVVRYELVVKDSLGVEKTFNLNTNSFVLNNLFAPDEYTVIVRAIGDGKNYISSIDSPEYVAVKLASPTNLKIIDGKITFVGVENASSYSLKIVSSAGKTTDVNTQLSTTFELDKTYDAGSYSIYVMANGSVSVGNLQNSEYSQVVENDAVIKLESPSNIRMQEGLLKWDGVENATKYYLLINSNLFNVGLKTSFDLPKQMQDINGIMQTFNAGEYNINIKAMGDGTDLVAGKYLNSNYDTNEMIFIKLPKISNFKVYNGELIWNEIPEAVNGISLIVKTQSEEERRVVLFNKTNFAFDSSYLTNIQYSVYAITLGNSTTMFNSDISETLTGIQKLKIPNNLKVGADNTLLFELDENAKRYTILLDGVETIYDATHQFVFGESVSEGEHRVKVKAMGADTSVETHPLDNKFVNSEYSSEIVVTKPQTPQNIAIVNGKVTWDACQYASGYKVEVYYTAVKDSAAVLLRTVDVKNQTYMYLSENGYYKIKVQAYFTDSLSSNWSKEQDGEFRLFAGLGTIQSPFQIKDAQTLRDMRYNPTAYYVMVNNVDISNDLNMGESGNYVSAGTNEDRFVGQFNGAGFTISNLTFNTAGTIYSALFGVIGKEGIVKNINFESVNITNGYYIGAVAGKNYGTIENCKVLSGSILLTTGNDTSSTYLGSIVGYNDLTTLEDGSTKIPGTIKNCYNNIELKHSSTSLVSYTGGIAGYNTGYIYQCKNNFVGTISGNIAGGITGANQGLINQCGNLSNVSALAVLSEGIEASGYAGGLVGYNSYVPFSSELNSILNCYNQGNINAYSEFIGKIPHAGGLVGLNKSRISRCYTTGNYSATALDASQTVYGAAVIGYNEAEVLYSYYKKNTPEIIDVNGTGLKYSAGYSESNLQTINFVEALSGTSGIFVFVENGNYPKLAFENA